MNNREEFEKKAYERPVEPYSSNENPEQWYRVLMWSEEYCVWLEEKVNKLEQQRDEAVDKMSFFELSEALIKYKAKSEYIQAAIIILRDIFDNAGKKTDKPEYAKHGSK